MVAKIQKLKQQQQQQHEQESETAIHMYRLKRIQSPNRNQFKMVRVMALLLRSCGRLIIFTFPRNLHSLYAATYILMNTLSRTHTNINMYKYIQCDVLETEMARHGTEASESHTASSAMQSKNPIWIHWMPATSTHIQCVRGWIKCTNTNIEHWLSVCTGTTQEVFRWAFCAIYHMEIFTVI